MKKILSYFLALAIAGLVIFPPVPCSIPVTVNQPLWMYMVLFAGLMGFYLLSLKIPLSLKILSVYLYATCFTTSMCPYLSFQAYTLLVITFYFFIACMYADKEVIIDMVCAAFWIQCLIVIMQLFGKDKLMNIDRPQPVFFGTVFQYMRFSSLLAIMTPFLILRNKWYLALIAVMCVISQSSSFILAVVGGVFVYLMLTFKKYRFPILLLGLISIIGCVILDFDSWRAEFLWGRFTVWPDVIKTWAFNTLHCEAPIARNYFQCPVDWKSIFFGRGTDTFLPLFPAFKHDPNPFPEAHNTYLQLLWEIGLLGFSLVMAYCVNLIRKLYKHKEYLLLAGLTCVAINAFFAMPDRMIQTILLMVAFLVICQKEKKNVLNYN